MLVPRWRRTAPTAESRAAPIALCNRAPARLLTFARPVGPGYCNATPGPVVAACCLGAERSSDPGRREPTHRTCDPFRAQSPGPQSRSRTTASSPRCSQPQPLDAWQRHSEARAAARAEAVVARSVPARLDVGDCDSAPGLLGRRFRASTITCCMGTGPTEGRCDLDHAAVAWPRVAVISSLPAHALLPIVPSSSDADDELDAPSLEIAEEPALACDHANSAARRHPADCFCAAEGEVVNLSHLSGATASAARCCSSREGRHTRAPVVVQGGARTFTSAM